MFLRRQTPASRGWKGRKQEVAICQRNSCKLPLNFPKWRLPAQISRNVFDRLNFRKGNICSPCPSPCSTSRPLTISACSGSTKSSVHAVMQRLSSKAPSPLVTCHHYVRPTGSLVYHQRPPAVIYLLPFVPEIHIHSRWLHIHRWSTWPSAVRRNGRGSLASTEFWLMRIYCRVGLTSATACECYIGSLRRFFCNVTPSVRV